MKHTLTLLSTVAMLTTAPALWAQEASTDAPADGTATEAPAQEAPRTGSGLDLGEDVPGGQAGQPETYIKETFTDWALQCLKVQADQEVCQMYQLLKEPGGASVAEVSMFKLENGGEAVAGGTFIVPLETLLPAKLTIQVDDGQPRRYDYSFCSQVGCYARVGFTAEDINRFKAGAAAKVTVIPALAPDQQVTVNMSLSGFTAAYDNVSSLRQ